MKTWKTQRMALVFTVMVGIIGIATFQLTLSESTTLQNSGTTLMQNVKVMVTGPDGYVKAYSQSANHIVENGMTILANNTFADLNATATPVNWLQIGTDGTASASTDTAVLAPIGGCTREDTAFTSAGPTSSGGFATISINGTATFLGTTCAAVDIDEAGIFNQNAGGVMFARNTFSAVNLGVNDQLTINWDFVFTDS